MHLFSSVSYFVFIVVGKIYPRGTSAFRLWVVVNAEGYLLVVVVVENLYCLSYGSHTSILTC